MALLFGEKTMNIHEMQLEKTYPTGSEKWTCPQCGRSFVLVWSPWNRIFLNAGDETIQHSGTKGQGLVMAKPEIKAQSDYPSNYYLN